MKLRNKKTGEIVELTTKRLNINSGSKNYGFSSLAELNAEWEDYKEPFSTSFYTIVDGKIKYCIFYSKRVAGCPDDAWAYFGDYGRESIKQLKEVGLYFETKEEAEKAVEKLKAWRRLRGLGLFRWGSLNEVKAACDYRHYVGIERDFEIVFGGEE